MSRLMELLKEIDDDCAGTATFDQRWIQLRTARIRDEVEVVEKKLKECVILREEAYTRLREREKFYKELLAGLGQHIPKPPDPTAPAHLKIVPKPEEIATESSEVRQQPNI